MALFILRKYEYNDILLFIELLLKEGCLTVGSSCINNFFDVPLSRLYSLMTSVSSKHLKSVAVVQYLRQKLRVLMTRRRFKVCQSSNLSNQGLALKSIFRYQIIQQRLNQIKDWRSACVFLSSGALKMTFSKVNPIFCDFV